MYMFVFQVALYNTDQEGSDSPRSSLNNSLSDQSLASVNLNSVGSVHSYTAVSLHGEVCSDGVHLCLAHIRYRYEKCSES